MIGGDAFAWWAYRGGAAVARALPEPLTGPAEVVFGTGLAVAARRRRQTVSRHVERLEGRSLPPGELRRQVRRTFRSYARYWIESFRLPTLSAAELDAGLSYQGIEHFDAAMAGGRGVIMALPHLGGWDYGGTWMATQGYPVTVVVEPIRPPELFEWFAAMRRGLGLEVVPLGPHAARRVIGALRRNEVVGLLCDRDLTGDGVEVEFFGERTTLPGGPATLALRTGAPILPTAIYFDGPRHHLGVVRPALPVGRVGSFRDDVVHVTQHLARELEHLIRRAPEQWHVLQPNWPSERGPAPARRRR